MQEEKKGFIGTVLDGVGALFQGIGMGFIAWKISDVLMNHDKQEPPATENTIQPDMPRERQTDNQLPEAKVSSEPLTPSESPNLVAGNTSKVR